MTSPVIAPALHIEPFAPRFSNWGTPFRWKSYKNQSFAGLFLLRFNAKNARLAKGRAILPDRPGPESKLGF